MMLFLDPCEIEELTGKRYRSAQKSALNRMGIIFRERADGSLAVLKSHIDKLFGGFDSHALKMKSEEPNIEGINA